MDAEASRRRGWRAVARPAPGAAITGSCTESLLTHRQVKRQEFWVFFFFHEMALLEFGSARLAAGSAKKNISWLKKWRQKDWSI